MGLVETLFDPPFNDLIRWLAVSSSSTSHLARAGLVIVNFQSVSDVAWIVAARTAAGGRCGHDLVVYLFQCSIRSSSSVPR